ncbi:MAG: dicarboxylate/amino acid:cation symporter, partial [Firmicutes bacterium]|nr:dicarboxylate/amino acid:cation symporter [Bacillota bacterium]MTI70158.1 dicarboxylate/amino acid:cation symporter [Bacillota bacterium]
MERFKKVLKNTGNLVIIAMILGILVGSYVPGSASFFAPFGDIFMKLIKMLVIPLVSVSIISGAASIGNTKSAGKIGMATFSYYMFTTMVAVTIGLVLGNIFKPGIGLDMATIQTMFSEEYVNKGATPGFWETVMGIIPLNPFKALLEGNILQILFFSLFLGFGISTLESHKKDSLLNGLNYITEALIWMIERV